MIERLRVRIPAGAVGGFSSPDLTFCADSFGVRSTPVLPQWHVRDPGHSAKSASGRLNLNTHTPFTQQNRSGLTTLSGHSVGTFQRNELTRNSSGNIWPQLSQFAEPLRIDAGVKSGISVRQLISTSKTTHTKSSGRQ